LPKKKSETDAVRLKKLVEMRSEFSKRRPAFVRPESWRYDRLSPEWRKPKGLDNKVRKSKKGWPRRAKVGYRGPLVSRYLHPSGHYDVMVHNQADLESLVPGRDVARMGATVGARKRALILKRAKELGLRVVNPTGLRIVAVESKK
jgi:large subunit ribosomal protein L32e